MSHRPFCHRHRRRRQSQSLQFAFYDAVNFRPHGDRSKISESVSDQSFWSFRFFWKYALFRLFSSFSHSNINHSFNFNNINWRKLRWCAWDLNTFSKAIIAYSNRYATLVQSETIKLRYHSSKHQQQQQQNSNVNYSRYVCDHLCPLTFSFSHILILSIGSNWQRVCQACSGIFKP